MNQTFKIGNAEITSELGTLKLEGIELTVEGLNLPEYIQLLKVLPTVVGALRLATQLSLEELINSVDEEEEAGHHIPKSPFDFFNVDSDVQSTHASSITDILQEMFGKQADEKDKELYKSGSFNPLEFMMKNADKIGPAKQTLDELLKAGAPFLKVKKVSGNDLLNIAQEAAKAVQREQALRAQKEASKTAEAYKQSKPYSPGQIKDKGNNTDFKI